MNSDILAHQLLTCSVPEFTRFCGELEVNYLNESSYIPPDASCYASGCYSTPTFKHMYIAHCYSCNVHRGIYFIYKLHTKCRELGCFTMSYRKNDLGFYCRLHK